MTESYFKSQSSFKPFLCDFSLEVSFTTTFYYWCNSASFSKIDLNPFLIICPSDVPGLYPSIGPRNYPSMFFSLFPIQDCGWVYRTNRTISINSNHSSISINSNHSSMSTSNSRFIHKNSYGLFPCLHTRRRISFSSIVDPFPNARLSPSFVQATSSNPSFDPSVVPILIPNYVTDIEPNQDTTFPNNDGIYTNDKFFPDKQGRHSIPRMNPGYSPSSYLDIASPVHAFSDSSDSNSSIQRRFQFRLIFLRIDPMHSSRLSIDSNNLDLSSHIPSDFMNIYSAPVLYSSFNSTIYKITMVVYFDVDRKRNEYQQFRFLLFFELTSLIRTRRTPSINSVFSYKSLQVLGVVH